MSRDIKFRAWDGERIFSHDQMRNFDFYHWCESPDVTIMQYTGLKDKNGVEIYEGDILSDDSQSEQHGGRIATIVVSYNSSVGAFTYGTTNPSQGGRWYKFFGTKPTRGLVPSENCEVIGNIYENPELLEANQ